MSSQSLGQILFDRWYTIVAGILISSVMAAMAHSVVPVQYMSNGTAALVRSKQPGLFSFNPLLTFAPTLIKNALVIVQTLSAPQVVTELGLTVGQDKLGMKNGALLPP